MPDEPKIPVKNLWQGEEYTEDEIRRLKKRWTGEQLEEIAKWINRPLLKRPG